MKRRLLPAALGLILFATLGAGLPAAAQAPLNKKEAEKLVKQIEKSLDEARQAGPRGQAQAAAGHLDRYAQDVERACQALVHPQLEPAEAVKLADRLDEIALASLPVLEALGTSLPAEARPALERALDASRRGHEAAVAALLDRGPAAPGARLNERQARAAMEHNDALLELAERARQRGDEPVVGRSLELYTANVAAISDAISRMAMGPLEAENVCDRVERSAGRHLSLLEALRAKLPEAGRTGVERALAASQEGRQVAATARDAIRAARLRSGSPGVRAGSARTPSAPPPKR